VIEPTVGRIVWFYKRVVDGAHEGPFAAIVAKVWSDRLVNLSVFSGTGVHYSDCNIALVQPGDDIPDSDYCAWMPHQIGLSMQPAEQEDQRRFAPA